MLLRRLLYSNYVKNGHEVIYHDLQAEKFDPLLFGEEIPKDAALDPLIEKHCKEISEASGIITIHLNWQGQPSTILKGYVDRIIHTCVAYEFLEVDKGEGVPNDLLNVETALIFNTANTPERKRTGGIWDPFKTI